MLKPGEEFQKRAGHRFNLITRSLPKEPKGAIQLEPLLQKLMRIGYSEGMSQLQVDLGALQKRGEVAAAAASDGKDAYYLLPKGVYESRKRIALIRLHNVEVSEADLELLEQISRRGKPLE
jgi:hypothetical protein